MIQLTRLRQNTPFILNPDLIERVDTHVDTVVRLTNGSEYVVNETGEEIVRRTADFRARVLALAGTLEMWAMSNAMADAPHQPVAVSAPVPVAGAAVPELEVPVDTVPAVTESDTHAATVESASATDEVVAS